MSYFIFSKSTGRFILETPEIVVLMCYPANEYTCVISHHGY